jgi:hypothetical protein
MSIPMTEEIARAAALDAGNRSMRAGGRMVWDLDDYTVACAELDRLWFVRVPGHPDPLGRGDTTE